MKRTAFTFAVVLGCLSCSTVEKKEEAVAKPPVAVTPVVEDRCAIVSRNLRVSWQQRQYWCSPEHKRNDAAVNTKVKNSTKKEWSKKLKQTRKQPVSQKTSAEKKIEAFMGKVVAGEFNPDGIKLAVKTYHVATDFMKKIEEEYQRKVWFAANVEVLGVNGAKTVREIITRKDKHKIKQIKLRGYASAIADKRRRKELDKLAVGRALSVRKLLAQNGIPRSKIKILYRDRDVNGRYVEVMVNETASL